MTEREHEEPINPPLPDQGPRDGTEASDDGPGDQVPGDHDGTVHDGTDHSGTEKADH